MKKVKIILAIIGVMLMFPTVAKAASGNISVTGPGTVVQGNKITVTVTLSSSTAIGSWQMDLNYDKSYLQLVSSSAEAGGTMMVNSSSGTKNKTYTFSFKALKTGTTRVSVSSYLVYAYQDNSELNINSSNKTVKIMTQQELEATYSKDNNLKNLTVEGYEISPTFDKDTLEYTVNVPTGTEKVKVNASVNDKTASVTGDGELTVTEGLNTLPIVVTAQNGSQKTYNLIVNVEDQNPINVKIEGKDYIVVKNASLLTTPETFEATTTTINDFEIPAFVNKNANITLVGLKDNSGEISLFIYNNGTYTKYSELNLKKDMLIPVDFTGELDYIKTTVTINGTKLEAYKYSENTDFVIINAKNLADGKTSLYLYDTKNETAQIFDETFINETNNTIKNYTYVIIAFASALVIMLILIFSLLHSLKKKQKKINKFLQKQEAKIEATRKLNDVVDEVKKITEAEKETKKKDKDFSLTEMISNLNIEEQEDKNNDKQNKDKKKSKSKAKEDEIKIKEIQVNPNDEIKKVMDDDEEVYDLFADDKKKKKKK